MTMKDWIKKLDEYLKLLGKGILQKPGNISAEDAQSKADSEYEIYKKSINKKFISDFDREAGKYLKDNK